MIDRDFKGGPIILRCDGCPAGDTDTGATAFQEAMAVARSEGWTVRYDGPGQGWCHFCPDCAEAGIGRGAAA